MNSKSLLAILIVPTLFAGAIASNQPTPVYGDNDNQIIFEVAGSEGGEPNDGGDDDGRGITIPGGINVGGNSPGHTDFGGGYVVVDPYIGIRPKKRKYAYSDFKEGRSYTGDYSQFTDIADVTSYIGHGYNVIDSPYMDKDYVKYRSPILDVNKIDSAQLKLVKETRSKSYEYSGSSMEEFTQNYGGSLNVYGNYAKVFSGGLKIQYKGSQEEKRFYSFYKAVCDVRTFDLHLTANLRTLRSMVSDDFLLDVEEMSPAQLFEEYGTHLITEVAMGGRVEYSTTYSSTKTGYTNEVDAAINAHIKYLGSTINTEIQANYSNELDSQNVEQKTEVSTLGGPLLGMRSIEGVNEHFDEWAETLGSDLSCSALCGIVGKQSLVPLWDLLPSSEQAKKNELEQYFIEAADDAYEELCSQFKLDMSRYVTTKTDGNGKIEGNNGKYKSGDLVTLNAVGNPGYEIEGWYIGDEKVSEASTYSFTISADVEITANFKPGNSNRGSGTQNDPYIICSLEGFRDIQNNLSAYYKLGCDIDFGNNLWEPIAGKFVGYLDGGNHTLSNIRIECLNGPFYNYRYFGLFQIIGSINGDGGYVHNLTIKNSSVKVTEYGGASAGVNMGILSGEVDKGRIENCDFIDTLIDTNITRALSGTIAGTISGTVINCNFKGIRIYGYAEIGGVAGSLSAGTQVDNCIVTNSDSRRSEIYHNAHKNQRFNVYAGGISGYAYDPKIRNCKVEQTDFILTGEINQWPSMGLIVGYSIDGFILNIPNTMNSITKLCSDSSYKMNYFAYGDGICGNAIRTLTSFSN